jgi:hypothetical protein
MVRILLAPLALVAATAPGHAHEAGGLFHLHPHGTEAMLVGLSVVVAAVFLWRAFGRRG